MKKMAFLALAASFALVGCSSTLPVQTGGLIQKNNGKKVAAEISQVNFLGFNPLTLEASEQILSKLQSQCGGSKVTGVTSLVTSRFLVLASVDGIQASGYCAE